MRWHVLTALVTAAAVAVPAWAFAPIPTPTGEARLVFAPCPFAPGRGACAHWAEAGRPATIWLDSKGVSDPDAFVHELGHLYDYTRLTDTDSQRFEAILHLHRPWRSPPNSPHERFAEAYRLCVQHPGRLPTVDPGPPRELLGGGYGYEPTQAQHRQICRLIRTAVRTPSVP